VSLILPLLLCPFKVKLSRHLSIFLIDIKIRKLKISCKGYLNVKTWYSLYKWLALSASTVTFRKKNFVLICFPPGKKQGSSVNFANTKMWLDYGHCCHLPLSSDFMSHSQQFPWNILFLRAPKGRRRPGRPLKRLLDDMTAETETGHPGLNSWWWWWWWWYFISTTLVNQWLVLFSIHHHSPHCICCTCVYGRFRTRICCLYGLKQFPWKCNLFNDRHKDMPQSEEWRLRKWTHVVCVKIW
jgi:hypothetical protein